MTEDEAKTKACCGGPDCGKVNDHAISREFRPRLCIASACMAWRVSDEQRYRAEEQTGDQQPAGDGWYALNANPSVGPIRWLRDVPLGPEGGFCGLAGAPQ